MAGNLAWEACKHSDYWVDFLQSKTCPLYRITRFQEFGLSQTNVGGCEIKQSEGEVYLLPIWAKHWCFDWNSICHQGEWSFQSNCWQSFIQTQVGNRVFFIYAKQVFQSVADGCFSGVSIEWLGLCCSCMSDDEYDTSLAYTRYFTLKPNAAQLEWVSWTLSTKKANKTWSKMISMLHKH